jgi:chromosome partitioning protein
MIYTIVSVSDTDAVRNAALAANLAASRAKEGRKVLLIEANLHMHLLLWTLRRYKREATLNFPVLPLTDGGLYQALHDHRSTYRDIVVNVGATNSSLLRSALIAAKVLIIPVTNQHMQLKNQGALKKITDTAKLLNPLVQTHLLPSGLPSSMLVQDYAVALAEQYPSCSVEANIIADSSEALRAFQRGLSIFEGVCDDDAEMRSMARLCRQLSSSAAGKALVR